jgi:hypothetical protein
VRFTESWVAHPGVKAAIEDALKAGWSPEQIAGRMRFEQHRICVSHETICRFAYSTIIYPNIGGVAGRKPTDDINAVASKTARACVTGPRPLPSVRSSATGSAI